METIKFKKKEFEVIKKYSNNKILAKFKDKQYIIVPFDNDADMRNYLMCKKALKRNKVEMSKVIKKDKKGLLVLEQYIQGESLLDIIAKNALGEDHYNELFRIYRNNRFAKIALSYKPENFIKRKKYFYYLSSEIYNYNETKAFERGSDVLLWMNTENQKNYIESKGYTYQDREIMKGGPVLRKQIALLCVKHW